MKKTKDAERLAEQALRSIDDIQPVEVNDFIFTRIQNRLEAKGRFAGTGNLRVMYRLSIVLLLFMAVNLSSYFLLKRTESNTPKQKTSGVAAFANDYDIKQNSDNY